MDFCPIPVFYRAVVPEKGDIVDRCFDAKYFLKFIIHFNRHRTHGMFDTAAFQADVVAVAQLDLVIRMKLLPQKSGDVIWLDRMNRCFDEFIIKRFQIILLFKDDISSIFSLHDTPMIVLLKGLLNRTKQPGIFIQKLMQHFDVELISKLLSLLKIINIIKGIIDELVSDVATIQLRG